MGKINHNFSLAARTTWKIGGPARTFYEPETLAELAEFLSKLPEKERLIWLGGGSNVLIADAGLNAVVISTKNLASTTRINDQTLRLEAGTSCASLLKYCLQFGLSGAEFLAGIPGTIGGALKMNAGAFNKQMWDLVLEVQTISRTGKITTRLPQEFTISYRHVLIPPDEWFVSATLKLAQGDTATIKEQIKKIITARHAKQPITEPSCGSVFCNPPNDSAGRLIEACGLKGKKIGGAQVSEKHANFIVNKGGAKASEVKQLIQLIQKEVKIKFSIDLVPEVQFLE